MYFMPFWSMPLVAYAREPLPVHTLIISEELKLSLSWESFISLTNLCQTKQPLDIILERIDCFGNKGECGVVLFIVLINYYERSLKGLEFTPIASKMRRDLLETEALKEFQRFQWFRRDSKYSDQILKIPQRF